MDSFPWRAIIVDFDRTLLHTDKTVSDRTVKVLRELQESGVRLFAATARPGRAITSYCDLIAFDAVTALNGARTVTPNAVFEQPVSQKSAESVLEQLRRTGGTVISVETENGIYANTAIPLWSPVVTDQIQALPEEHKIYKILASHPDLPISRIIPDLPEDTYSSVADGNLIQIMSTGATKWNGVQKMLEAYRLTAEEAVYFGDDNDDLEPIRRCGCGVAVSNALEHVREAADYVTKSNDEDGVAFFLSTAFRPMSLEEVLQKPYWVINILPRQVPANSPGQYFSVEKYYLDPDRLASVRQKHINIILKLNCYRNLSLNEEAALNPPPEQIAEEMAKHSVTIRFGNTAILSEPDETHMTVFNPDQPLLELIRQLAAGEGLFVWEPPVQPEQNHLTSESGAENADL